MRFLDMSPALALQNADSYALFAAAIGTNHVPVTGLVNLRAGAGVAVSAASPTWFVQAYAGAEFQHPRIRLFHPTLGVGVTVIGESENRDTGKRASLSTVVSLLGGFRIGAPRRPGTGTGLELTLRGGPSVAIAQQPDSSGRVQLNTRVGAELGATLGYRWRLIDVSAGVGYLDVPTRGGAENLLTVGGALTLHLF